MKHPSSAPLEQGTIQRGFEQVCDQIRNLLATGALQVGDKLPPERELAEKLSVSRGVVREALRSLEIAGLVTSRKGRSGGTFITAGDSGWFTRAVGDMMRLGTISLTELTEARTMIMVDAIVLACERATEADLQALELNIEQTEAYTREKDYERRRDAATDFYRLLALASKNQMLVLIVEATTRTLRQFLRSPATRPLEHLIDSRRSLMKCLRERNAAKATREMRTYLAGLHQYMLAAEAKERSAMKPKARRVKAPV